MMLLLVAAALAAHPFTPAVWSALRSARAVDVSKNGREILYDVSHGAAKGPTVHEWWTIAPDGSGARRLSIPKGFDVAGFTAGGELAGTYAKGDGEAQVAVLTIGS